MGFWIFTICLLVVLAIIFYITAVLENTTEDVEDVIKRLKGEQNEDLLNTKHNCNCGCCHEEEHKCDADGDRKCGENCNCRK